MLATFSRSPMPASREILGYKRRLGGQVGTLRVGRESQEVLRLPGGVFVAASRPSKGVQTALTMDQQDLHVVTTGAELETLARRHKAFIGGRGGEAKA